MLIWAAYNHGMGTSLLLKDTMPRKKKVNLGCLNKRKEDILSSI